MLRPGRAYNRACPAGPAVIRSGYPLDSHRLVMSGSPMLGANRAVGEPTPLTLLLAYIGNCWLIIGTTTASFMICMSAWCQNVPAAEIDGATSAFLISELTV